MGSSFGAQIFLAVAFLWFFPCFLEIFNLSRIASVISHASRAAAPPAAVTSEPAGLKKGVLLLHWQLILSFTPQSDIDCTVMFHLHGLSC